MLLNRIPNDFHLTSEEILWSAVFRLKGTEMTFMPELVHVVLDPFELSVLELRSSAQWHNSDTEIANIESYHHSDSVF